MSNSKDEKKSKRKSSSQKAKKKQEHNAKKKLESKVEAEAKLAPKTKAKKKPKTKMKKKSQTEMKKFIATGRFMMGDKLQKFRKEIESTGEQRVREKIFQDLGSKHRVKRSRVLITAVEEVK